MPSSDLLDLRKGEPGTHGKRQDLPRKHGADGDTLGDRAGVAERGAVRHGKRIVNAALDPLLLEVVQQGVTTRMPDDVEMINVARGRPSRWGPRRKSRQAAPRSGPPPTDGASFQPARRFNLTSRTAACTVSSRLLYPANWNSFLRCWP